MQNLLKFLSKKDIGNPPWDYYFLQNLDEKEYPRYLAKIFNYRTGETLPLSKKLRVENGELKINYTLAREKLKTFNQKIQWIKLYGITDLMCDCTDKVKVRDYVCECIGEEYLKPVLQICDSFEEINFDKLSNSFVIKCNHGCKWQYIIKDKNTFLQNKQLFNRVRNQFAGWLNQKFWIWCGFEMNYHGIEPKILIELFFYNEDNIPLREIEIYCFNGKPKIFVNVRYGKQREISVYNENFNQIDLIFHPDGNNIVVEGKADDLINRTFVLSEQLTRNFNFVRVDWLVFKNKLYFNELTFTPYSGFIKFNKKWNLKLGSLINI